MMKRKRTVLVVDDTVANLDILVELLSDYDIIESTRGEDALEIIGQEQIDLILLDIVMPGMDGYTVCQRLKHDLRYAEIPVIFITSMSDEAAIEKAYDAGAVDYVTKPFKPKELLARVRIQIEHLELIEKLEFLASHDPMTGIYNRRKFFELAEKVFRRKPHNLYAAMIDIDRFKSINDSYGHPVGDQVIRGVAAIIQESIDEHNIFGRLGGEEFALLGCYSSREQVTSHLEKVREKVEAMVVEADSGELLSCTICVGIAENNITIKNLDELLSQADKMLYEAKGTGRNRVIFRI
ncbi:MAG: diguanylate cyclase [Deltaproteobacteria bacterium]|nr:diguanylate cyclase [Deltaproteobacteria bacterium]